MSLRLAVIEHRAKNAVAAVAITTTLVTIPLEASPVVPAIEARREERSHAPHDHTDAAGEHTPAVAERPSSAVSVGADHVPPRRWLPHFQRLVVVPTSSRASTPIYQWYE